MAINKQEIDASQAVYYDAFGELPPIPFGMPDKVVIFAIETAIKSNVKIDENFKFDEQLEDELLF